MKPHMVRLILANHERRVWSFRSIDVMHDGAGRERLPECVFRSNAMEPHRLSIAHMKNWVALRWFKPSMMPRHEAMIGPALGAVAPLRLSCPLAAPAAALPRLVIFRRVREHNRPAPRFCGKVMKPDEAQRLAGDPALRGVIVWSERRLLAAPAGAVSQPPAPSTPHRCPAGRSRRPGPRASLPRGASGASRISA